jgi:hypothetical protein
MKMDDPNAAFVRNLAAGYWTSRCLHMAADLGIADMIGDAPVSVATLAAKAGVLEDSLNRMLRALAAVGVFEDHDRAYGHSASSRYLRRDHPQSIDGFVRFMGADYQWASWGAMLHSLKTGQAAFDHLYGCNSFEYLGQNPKDGAVFDLAMTGKAEADNALLLQTYDFSVFGTIADIGGGRGHLLRAILGQAPKTQGVLFDLPQVVARADTSGEIGARMKVQGGDFFADPMPVCDAYTMMMVLHDWSDEASVAILKNLRKAVPPHAKLLIIEAELKAEGEGAALGKIADMEMLVVVGGRERMEQEYVALFERSGFRFTRTVTTHGFLAVTEAVPA